MIKGRASLNASPAGNAKLSRVPLGTTVRVSCSPGAERREIKDMTAQFRILPEGRGAYE